MLHAAVCYNEAKELGKKKKLSPGARKESSIMGQEEPSASVQAQGICS
jgi:hypothetical protein